MRTVAILLSGLLLAGCQTPPVDADYDSSRDFARYQRWQWQQPALDYRPDDPRLRSDLTEQRILAALGEQLEQRGLRQASDGQPAQLTVKVFYIVEARQEQYTSHYGGYYGGYWGGFWGGPAYSETREREYRVLSLQVDLHDAADGKLVWRGSSAQLLDSRPQTPAQREAQLRLSVEQILRNYPPPR